jgi:hypothetical protein
MYSDSDCKRHSDFINQDVRDGINWTTNTLDGYDKKTWYRHGQRYATAYEKYIVWYTRGLNECKSCCNQTLRIMKYKCNCRNILVGPIIKRVRLMLNRRK